MKNYFKTGLSLLQEVAIRNYKTRYLFFSSIILAVIDYLIWKIMLSGPDIFVYIRISIYPIQYLTIILAINTFLAFIAYEKEREISYLLFMANLLVGGLILVLEFFYLAVS